MRPADDTPLAPDRTLSGSSRLREDELGLGEYLQTLLRHSRLVLAGIVVGALAGFAYASARTEFYEATAIVLLSAAPDEEPAPVASYRALIENGALASEVVQELGLDRAPHHVHPGDFLAEAVTVTASSQESRFPLTLQVNVRLADPALAIEAARRLTHKAIALNDHIGQRDRAAQREDLEASLEAASARLREAEEDLLTYQQQAQIELLRRDTEALLDERQALPKLLVEIESEKARLAAAEEELLRHQPFLPAARAVAADDALRHSVEHSDAAPPTPGHRSVNPVYQTLEVQIATSRANLASLEAQRHELIDVLKIGGAQLPQLALQYERELELARRQSRYYLIDRMYGDLALRYEQAKTQGLGTGVRFQVVDEGALPTQPLPRGRLRWMVLGLFTGALVSIVGVFVLDAARHARRAGAR